MIASAADGRAATDDERLLDQLPAEGINTSDDHPLREFALLVVGLVGAVVVFVVIAALVVDRLVLLAPPAFEARWFADWALAGAEDPRRPALQALVDRLASHCGDPPYIRVGVLDDEPEPNALALPGRVVLVTSGLLETVQSENELALVLAHEIGHYEARDHLRGLGRGLGLWVVANALGYGDELVSGLGNLAGQLAQRSFDRRQETAADEFGLALVQAEYGHVAGTSDFFARLAREDGSAGALPRIPGYLGTHPLSADRVAALEAEAVAHGWATEGALTPLELPTAE